MEDYSLTISIYSRQLELLLSDFEKLTPLVTLEEVAITFRKPSQDEVAAINHILYYVISVVHRVPIQQYERVVQKAISPFYIKNKMKIKIYQYSKFCSDLLGVNVYQCVHVIHYLVYGCFASASYVNMIVDSREQAIDKKEKPKLQKKTNIPQNEKEIFLKDLEDTLKADTFEEKEQKPVQQGFNHRINHNPYQIKLPHVDGRQTSPMMSILRRRTPEIGSTIRISRKVRHKGIFGLTSSFFNNPSKDKGNIVPSEKKSFQNKRVDLKTLLDIKQKIKTENKFLDQLRVALTSSDSNFQRFRSKQPYNQILDKVSLELPMKQVVQPSPKHEKVQVNISPPPPVLNDKKSDSIVTVVQNYEKQNDNFNYQYMSVTQKSPFRSKLNIYKKEYKQFLRTRSKQFSCIN